MKAPKQHRPARSLFERAEITTKDVAAFALFYGVLPLGFFLYVWLTSWGHDGTDALTAAVTVWWWKCARDGQITSQDIGS